MNAPDGLFIYGTLCEGGRHHLWLDRTDPEGSSPAWAPGRLFHLPGEGYPALVSGSEPDAGPPGHGWVRGEFVGYADEAALEAALEDLDPLEDVDGGLFERRITPIILEGGQRFLAWVYVFPEDRLPVLEKKAVELPHGDWESYRSGDEP